MKIDTPQKRLNYNVPQHLIPSILLIAETHGVTPAYWLRQTLEKAVNAYQQQLPHSLKGDYGNGL